LINIFSIRFRIAAWYFLSAAPILVALAVGSWFAMRASMYQGIDEELFRRTLGVEQFLQSRGDNAIPELEAEQSNGPELPVGGGLFQVFDANEKLLFQSSAIARHHIASLGPITTWSKPNYRDSALSGDRVRLGARQTSINGKIFTIQAAEPLRSFDESLSDFARLLYLSIPALLLILAAAGFWLSGRAMAPIEQINHEARAIGANNLTSRLSVPKPRDELRTLSETLNAMLERIEISVNRLTQFTADASHELRAPLTLIQMAAEYSLRRERSREELLDALGKILRETNRTAALVDRLLELARADASKCLAPAVPVELTFLLQEVAESAASLAITKQIQFTAQIGYDPVRVNGDDASFRELFLILIDNAVKYTPEHGAVSLRLHAGRDIVTIEVEDNGIGISPEDIPHVFDRFWRADKVRSRQMGGTGLGLSIAKWIAEQSHGSITADSTLGSGSKFCVRLPLAPDLPPSSNHSFERESSHAL